MSKRIVGLDFETETDEVGNSRPLLCCLYNDKYEDTFELTVRKDYERFYRTLIVSGDKYVVFNASFDIEIIIIMLLKNKWKFLKNDEQPSHKSMKLVMGQKIYSLSTYYELNGDLIESDYVDLGNLIVGATLEEIAANFTDERKGNFEASKKDWELFKEYCMKDARITWKAYMKVIEMLGKEYLTIGSAAFNILLEMAFPKQKTKQSRMKMFKRIFGETTIEEDKYLRKWYAGGFGWSSTDHRTETRVHSYDKKSAYPWASYGKLPTLIGALTYEGYKEPTEEFPFSFIKLRVTGQIKENHAPILPSRNIYGDSNIYIYDDKIVHIIQEYGKVSEYEHWLRNMEIDEIEYIETITMKAAVKNIIEPYMSKFYEMKNTASGVLRDFAKRMLNALTGKLGTNPIKDNVEFSLNEINKMVKTGSEEVEIETYATHVIAVITSRIRCALYEVDEEIRDLVSFRMYATDSVKHSTEVKDIIKTGTELGDWALEHEDTSFIFLGLKAYIFDALNEKGERDVMCAGISRKYKPLITNEMFYASTLVKSLISVRSGNGRIIYEGMKKIASPIQKQRRRNQLVDKQQDRPEKVKNEESIRRPSKRSLSRDKRVKQGEIEITLI